MISVAVLVAIGIAEGMRSILGVSVSLSEAEVHWRDFLSSLRDRGLCGLQLVTTDDHPGEVTERTLRYSGWVGGLT